MLTITLIRETAELEALVPEWEVLAASLRPLTPFVTPLWCLLWWRHFRQTRSLVRDNLRAYVFRDEQSRLIAVAPMLLTQRPGIGPMRTCQLQFFGSDPNMTELRGLICAPEHELEVATALATRLQTSDSCQWHWLQWSGLRSTEAELKARMPDVPLVFTGSIPDYYLNLPESWEQFRAGLSRNIKESLRKCYNSLKRDGHEFEFRVVSRPEETGAAIARFIELHAARADATARVRHNNVFASAQSQAFLVEYAQAMAERGQLRIFQISIAGVVVATRIGFVFGRSLYLYYSGYDSAWARYSIMTTVVSEALKWAIENGLDTANLSTGTDVSKTRWGAHEVRYHNALLRGQTLSARLAFGTYSGLKSAASQTRSLAA